jgi:hypothetical protein
MATRSVPQRRYDHRLRDLVQRTGDLTIAIDLGIPRSTARGWLGARPSAVVSLEGQLAVVNRSRRPRLRLTPVDRMLWAWLSRSWHGWRSAIHIVKPETVIAWHRRGFRLFWTWKSRHRTGRPTVPDDVRALIREMSTANPSGARRGFTGNFKSWESP